MKILILIPGENARGGITNYYSSLRKHLPENIVYFERGSRNWPKKANFLIEISRIIADYIRFIYILIIKRISVVQTTTAFYKGSIIRDGLFLVLAMLFRKKTIVFFRGWNDQYVYGLSGISLKLFKLVYFRTNAIIDLSVKNVEYLKKLGYKNKIYLETTVVDVNLTKEIDIVAQIDKRFKRETKTILYISRVEKAKGVYKLLDIYKEIRKNNPDYKLVIAGDGSEWENLKTKVGLDQIPDVNLPGFVFGEEKIRLFKESSIFIFLSEFEGMPNAVLEAMAFGLPVITTNVGGISSVFNDNQNGYLINECSPIEIVNKVNQIVYNHNLYSSFSLNNYQDSHNTMMSDVVANRMLTIFSEVLETN